MADESSTEEETALHSQPRAPFDLLSDDLREDGLLGEVLGCDDDAIAAEDVAGAGRGEREDENGTRGGHTALISARRIGAEA